MKRRGDGLKICKCGKSKHPCAIHCRQCCPARGWLPQEDSHLQAAVIEGWPYKQIAKLLGRTIEACRLRASAKDWRMSREAVLENRKAGRAVFWNDPARVAKWKAEVYKQYTPLDRRIRSEEARRMVAAGRFSFKGHHHTTEAKKRIKAAMKKRRHSSITKQRMSVAAKERWIKRKAGPLQPQRQIATSWEGKFKAYDPELEVTKVWCDQCEMRVLPKELRNCRSPFCKAK